MRTAVDTLEDFYETVLGRLVAEILAEKVEQAWGRADRLRVAAFGYGGPVLANLADAESRLVLVPEGMGARAGEVVPNCLVHDHAWPLPDASIERLIIVHGLEEVSGPRRLLREAWRVLSPDGLLIVIAANRRGPWSVVETSPFAAGRPYSRRQLVGLLEQTMFTPTAFATALHFPPVKSPAFLRVARTWERLGSSLENWQLGFLPNLAGTNLIEARKSTAVPIGGAKAELFRPRILVPQPLRPATGYTGQQRTKSAVSETKFARPGWSGENGRKPS